MQRVYGKSYRTMPLGERMPGVVIPAVSPLPGPNAPTPRRRHTVVCSNLLVERETWNLDEARGRIREALKGDEPDPAPVAQPALFEEAGT